MTKYIDQNYKDANGRVHFLSAADHESAAAHNLPLPDPSWDAISEDETAALLAVINQPAPVPLNTQAKIALDASDVTMIRCVEAGVAVPAAWNSYRKELRAIATGKDATSTSLPTKPAYPAGT